MLRGRPKGFVHPRAKETQEYEGQTEAWFKDTKDLVIAIDDMERGAQLEGLLTAGMMSEKKKDLRKLTEAGQTAEEETRSVTGIATKARRHS